MTTIKERRSLWPLALTAAMLVVIAVNIYMVTMAIQSSPGEFEADAYQRGLEFQKTIDARNAFAANNWTPKVVISNTEQGSTVTLLVSDSHGATVRELSGTVLLKRPADHKLDQSARLLFDSNAYTATFPQLLPGLWYVEFSLTHPTIPGGLSLRVESILARE